MASAQGSVRTDEAYLEYQQSGQRDEDKKEGHKADFDEGVKEYKSAILKYRQDSAVSGIETDFMKHDLNAMKKMVEREDGDDNVRKVADAWDDVRDQLVGGPGGSGGGAYGDLKRAVEGALEHWSGESAEGFRKESNRLLQQIKNSASHCDTVAEVLRKAADVYKSAHKALAGMEEPGWFDKAKDCIGDLFDRDDSLTDEAIKNRDIPKDLLAKIDEGYLGESKEVQLQAAAHMETLAR